MKSTRKKKFEATPIAIRLMHDWINEELKCGGAHSLRSDVYIKTIPEGKYANQIVSYVSELLADQQSSLIRKSFPEFESKERSNQFLGQLRALSKERLETALYSYLIYEIEIDEKELHRVAQKLKAIRDEKLKVESEKVIFDQDGLEYLKLRRKLEEVSTATMFSKLTWDLYPKKPFSKEYTVLCKSILNLIK